MKNVWPFALRFLIFWLAVVSAPASQAADEFTYDELGRLTIVDYDDGSSVSFQYDSAGNRTQITATSTNSPDLDPNRPVAGVVVVPLNGFLVIPLG